MLHVYDGFSSTSWEDEMSHAAAWLAYAVTSTDPAFKDYLADAVFYLQKGVAWSLSWDDKRPILMVTYRNCQMYGPSTYVYIYFIYFVNYPSMDYLTHLPIIYYQRH